MRHSRLSRTAPLGATLVAAVLFSAPLRAQQDFPNRPINLVAPFAPGGNVDLTARTIADRLSKVLGQPVIVDNRAGAGGLIGTTYVTRATPDGYTLLLAGSGTNAVPNAVSKKVPYDGVKSFTVIGGITLTGRAAQEAHRLTGRPEQQSAPLPRTGCSGCCGH